MYLQYYLDGSGKRVYTLKKMSPDGKSTLSAHPARFSPDDKYSKHRILVKQRFGILLTQQPAPEYWLSATGSWILIISNMPLRTDHPSQLDSALTIVPVLHYYSCVPVSVIDNRDDDVIIC